MTTEGQVSLAEEVVATLTSLGVEEVVMEGMMLQEVLEDCSIEGRKGDDCCRVVVKEDKD